jgi:hypothetical protein
MPWFLPLCEMLITGEKIRCSLAAWRQRADHHSYIDTCLTINCWAGAAWPHAWTIPQSGRVMNSRDTWLASAGGLHIASVQPSCIWFFSYYWASLSSTITVLLERILGALFPDLVNSPCEELVGWRLGAALPFSFLNSCAEIESDESDVDHDESMDAHTLRFTRVEDSVLPPVASRAATTSTYAGCRRRLLHRATTKPPHPTTAIAAPPRRRVVSL